VILPARKGGTVTSVGAKRCPCALRGAWKALLASCLAAVIGTGGASAAPSPATATAPTKAATADELKSVLMKEAAAGKLTDPLIAHFKDYAAAAAREKLVPGEVSEEFWTWFVAHRELRDPLLIYTFPDFKPGPYRALELLRAKYGDQVAAFSQLALAMSLVYGMEPMRLSSGEATGPICNREIGRGETDRPAPSLQDSFGWYVKNERLMKMQLKTTPLPLMLYVADNDLPLEEREWALKKFATLQPNNYGSIYYDVPYDYSAVNSDKGKLEGKSKTLANIVANGGVCMHRAYYASRILKSFGVPSFGDSGMGNRGGHEWVAWVGVDRQGAALLSSGRFDYDLYYTGTTFSFLRRKDVLDHDIELDAIAVSRSYPAFLDALAACYIFQMGDKFKAADQLGLLEEAIRRNPYCDETWRLVALYCAKGYIPQAQGERMYESMLKSFAAYPDLTFDVLKQILAPRLLATGATPPKAEIAANLQLLERAFKVYELARRPDLAVRLRALQGQYLEAVGSRQEALVVYATNSEKYAAQHFGFLELFLRAVKMMNEDRQQETLQKYLARMATIVPEFQGDFGKKYDIQNPSFITVVTTYADCLREAGKMAEAEKMEAKIKKSK
jgi:hypothetical protein